VTYNYPGTYTLTTNAQDYWHNPCDTTSTLAVTVTDPCVENPPNCDDGNPCTDDSCVVQGGQAACAHDAVADYQVCGTNKACEAGVCKTTCVVLPNYLCAAPTPAHSQSHNADYYCTGSPQCFTCDSGFHPDGGQCVSDVTCQDECSPEGTVGCQDSMHTKTCSDWDSDGCLEWGGVQECPAGTACDGGACVQQCQNQCTDGAMRCSGATVQTCGYYGGACTSWQDTTTCVAPTPFCLEDGSAASCVQCRDATDCAAGEACVNDACCADADGDGQCDSVQLTLSGPASATVGTPFLLSALLQPVSAATTITIDGHALWCTLAGSVCSASRSVTEQAPGTHQYTASASVGGQGLSASASVRF